MYHCRYREELQNSAAIVRGLCTHHLSYCSTGWKTKIHYTLHRSTCCGVTRSFIFVQDIRFFSSLSGQLQSTVTVYSLLQFYICQSYTCFCPNYFMLNVYLMPVSSSYIELSCQWCYELSANVTVSLLSCWCLASLMFNCGCLKYWSSCFYLLL